MPLAEYPEYLYVCYLARGQWRAYVQNARGETEDKQFASKGAAIAWAKRKATELGIDENRNVSIFGESHEHIGQRC